VIVNLWRYRSFILRNAASDPLDPTDFCYALDAVKAS